MEMDNNMLLSIYTSKVDVHRNAPFDWNMAGKSEQ